MKKSNSELINEINPNGENGLEVPFLDVMVHIINHKDTDEMLREHTFQSLFTVCNLFPKKDLIVKYITKIALFCYNKSIQQQSIDYLLDMPRNNNPHMSLSLYDTPLAKELYEKLIKKNFDDYAKN